MLIASFLAEANHQVTLIVRRQEQVTQIIHNGLIRRNLDQSLQKNVVHVTTDFSSIRNDSIVIIAVKYGQLKNIYLKLQNVHLDSPLLFLQNGLAHFEEVVNLPHRSIAFASCQFGAQKENDYTVSHRGQGVVKLSIERGNDELFEFLRIGHRNFHVEFEANAEQMLFEKALYNCFINPLTAILNVKNGTLLHSEHTMNIVENMYDEIINAFPEVKIWFQLENVIELCKKTSSNTSSMLSDRLNNRRTEVDSIVGAVIKRASKRGVTLPTLSTLYYLVKALEESGEKM